MKLSELVKILSIETTNDTLIRELCIDSRKVQKGDLFIAYPGLKSDGRKYIEQAIQQGASAIIFEDTPDFSFTNSVIPSFPVKNLPTYLSALADTFYHHPSKKMNMVAVTGTNGKTTCTQLIAKTLHAANIPSAVIGTLGYGLVEDKLTPQTHTTPDPISLQYQLSVLQKKAKITAMEVSSHALIQKRIQGIEFDVAIFTNLSREHLDYHKTMDNYWKAKCILFKDYRIKHAVINLDDPYGLDLFQLLKEKESLVGYTIAEDVPSLNPAIPVMKAQQIRLSSKGISAKVVSPWGTGFLKSSLLGRFNLSNLLASLSALCLLNLDFEEALHHLSKIKTIPGRMQTLGGKKQPQIVIDYAHTPDALQQSLMALREHTQGKIWCVFGCGGDRDSGKRPLMGQIAERYSDRLIITDDNPRNENPKLIVQEIISGLSCPWAAEIEHDRRVAIAHAVDCAKAGDIILIAGKGHEHYQSILDKKIEFNDFEQAQLALQAKEQLND